MIKELKKFGGAIILYLVIFGGVIAITSRFADLNEGINREISINK